jgi:PAS domain S-box-containing protein
MADKQKNSPSISDNFLDHSPMHRILYIDDDPGLLEIGKFFLESDGAFAVDTFMSASEALDHLKSIPYDAIISDYQMPETDGITFLKTLRSSGNTTPFIIFTGRGREEIAIEALNSGADFYHKKGGDCNSQFVELAHKIHHAISRRVAVCALKKSEQDYRNLINHANEAIYVVQDGLLRMINPRTAELSGYSEEELLEQPFIRFVHPEDHDLLLDRYKKRIDGEMAPSRYSFRLSRKDGTTRWVELSVVAITWDERPATLNFLIDITEHKLAGDALRESETRYREFFKTTLDSVFITTPEGQFIDFNDALVEMFGFKGREEISQVPVSSIYANPGERDVFIKNVEREGYVKEHPMKLRKRDGTVFDSLITLVPQRNPDGSLKAFIGTFKDITEWKRVDDALRESERRYRNVVEGQTEFICRFLPDGTHAFVNEAYCRYFGLDQKEIIGSRFRPKIPPGDEESVHHFFVSLTPESPVGSIENRVIMPDGSIRWLQWSDRAIFDPAGENVIEYQSVGRDISNRKEIEFALEKSEQRKNAIVAAMPDTLVILSRDGVYQDYHSNDEGIRSLHMGEIIGTNIRDSSISPDAVERILRIIALTIDTGDLQQIEYDVTYHSDCHHIEARFVRLDEKRVLGVIRDVTQYKKLVETLKENEIRFKQIYEAIEDLYFQTDNEGIIRILSPSIVLFTGRKADDLIGMPLSDIFENPEECAGIRSTLFETGSVHDYDIMLKKMDGTTILTSFSVFLMKDNKGIPVGVSGLVRDITERKQAEKALRQANRQLNLLTSITRHDINNQLTVLLGYLARIQKKQPDPLFSEYFQKVTTAAERISVMIQFTREFGEIGISAPAWQEIRTLVDKTSKEAPPGNVMVKNDLPTGMEIFADPLIMKVFYNLMDNAVRHGGEITAIRFFMQGRDGVHIIVCEDDGAGVPAEEKEYIFNRRFGKNTGLGLALSREILLITGITITENGEPGKGARFEMTVPAGCYRREPDENN